MSGENIELTDNVPDSKKENFDPFKKLGDYYAATTKAVTDWAQGQLTVRQEKAAAAQESKLKGSIGAMIGLTKPEEIQVFELYNRPQYAVSIPGLGPKSGFLPENIDTKDAAAVKAAVIADLYELYKDRNAIPAIDLVSTPESAQQLKAHMDKLSAAITKVNEDAKLQGEGKYMPAEQMLDFFSKLGRNVKSGKNYAAEMKKIISPEFRDSILNREVIIPGKLGSDKSETVKMKDVPKALEHRIQGLKNEIDGLNKLSAGLKPTDEVADKIAKVQEQLDVLVPMHEDISTIVKATKDPRMTSAKWLDRSMMAMKGLASVTGLAVLGGVGYGAYTGIVAAMQGSAVLTGVGIGIGVGLGAAVPIIGWAALGVAALAVIAYGAYQTYKHWDEISKYMSDKGQEISAGAARLWNNLGEVLTAARAYLGAVANSIVRMTQQVMLDAGLYRPSRFKDDQLDSSDKTGLEEAIAYAYMAVYASNPQESVVTLNTKLLSSFRTDNEDEIVHDEKSILKGAEGLRSKHNLFYTKEAYSSAHGVEHKMFSLHAEGELDIDQTNLKTLAGMIGLLEELKTAEVKLDNLIINIVNSKDDHLSQATYDQIATIRKSLYRQRVNVEQGISVEKIKLSNDQMKELLTYVKQSVVGLNLKEAKKRVDQLQKDIIKNNKSIVLSELKMKQLKLSENLRSKNEEVTKLEKQVKQAIEGSGNVVLDEKGEVDEAAIKNGEVNETALNDLTNKLKTAKAEADALHDDIEALSEPVKKRGVLAEQLKKAEAVVQKLQDKADAPTMRERASAGVKAARDAARQASEGVRSTVAAAKKATRGVTRKADISTPEERESLLSDDSPRSNEPEVTAGSDVSKTPHNKSRHAAFKQTSDGTEINNSQDHVKDQDQNAKPSSSGFFSGGVAGAAQQVGEFLFGKTPKNKQEDVQSPLHEGQPTLDDLKQELEDAKKVVADLPNNVTKEERASAAERVKNLESKIEAAESSQGNTLKPGSQ